MTQKLLLPDPRPLVERLGAEFFRQAPERPGVYLMRDAAAAVVYVGKAKNLRKRLGSYRVANPDRLRRRHLRLLRAITRIELEECPDESAARARESELLRQLRPRFNRAGTWPGPRWFLGWRVTAPGLELAVAKVIEPGWRFRGPFGASVITLRAALVRVLWCVLRPDRGLRGLPEGWFGGRHGPIATLPRQESAPADVHEAEAWLGSLFAGRADAFADWIRRRTATEAHPFEAAAREADLETVSEFASRHPFVHPDA